MTDIKEIGYAEMHGLFFLPLKKNRNKNNPYNEDWEYKPVGGPDVDEAEKAAR